MLAEFIDFESRCCAFLQFDLSLAPEAQRVIAEPYWRRADQAVPRNHDAVGGV